MADDERAQCPTVSATPKPAKVSTDCAAALEDLRLRREAFLSELRTRRADFDREQKQATASFSESPHAQGEWEDFRALLDARRNAFEREVQRDFDSFEATFEQPQACEGEGAARAEVETPLSCVPEENEYPRFKAYVKEQDHLFRERQRAIREEFESYQRAAREDSGNAASAADEGTDDLATRPDWERSAFEQRSADDAARHGAALERRWAEFKDSAAKACLGLQGSGGFEEVRTELRAEVLDCDLGFQDEFTAFHELHGPDEEAWDDAEREEFEQLRADGESHRASCETGVHNDWKVEAKRRIQSLPRTDRFGKFIAEELDEAEGVVQGRYVSFDYAIGYEPGSLTIRQLSVQGLLAVEELSTPLGAEPSDPLGGLNEERIEWQAEWSDEACESESIESSSCAHVFDLLLHDDSTGRLEVTCSKEPRAPFAKRAGSPTACRLRFPPHAQITPLPQDPLADGNASYSVALGPQQARLEVRGDHFWQQEQVEFFHELALFLPAHNLVFDGFANQHRDAINAAVQDSRVLAEIDVVGEPGSLRSQIQAYRGFGEGGLRAGSTVCVEPNLAGRDGAVVDLASDLAIGRTTVLNFDASLFRIQDLASATTADFNVQYYAINDAGEASLAEIHAAADVEDALQADEEVAEWYLVQDHTGLQVLLSVPSFSTKRFVIESKGAAEDLGVILLLLLLAGAAVVVAWVLRKRRAEGAP